MWVRAAYTGEKVYRLRPWPVVVPSGMMPLALASVAVMPLLVVPGYFEPDAEPGAVHTATVLVVIGFGMLLMLVPFHGQLVAIAAHSAPMVPAFVLSAFPAVV